MVGDRPRRLARQELGQAGQPVLAASDLGQPTTESGARPQGPQPFPMPDPQPDKEDELAGTEQPFVAHLVELRDRVAARPKIKAYLASDRRIPFNEDGIFRRYKELDT